MAVREPSYPRHAADSSPRAELGLGPDMKSATKAQQIMHLADVDVIE